MEDGSQRPLNIATYTVSPYDFQNIYANHLHVDKEENIIYLFFFFMFTLVKVFSSVFFTNNNDISNLSRKIISQITFSLMVIGINNI